MLLRNEQHILMRDREWKACSDAPLRKGERNRRATARETRTNADEGLGATEQVQT